MYPDFEIDIYSDSAYDPEEAYQLNNKLKMAWEIVEQTGSNLFLTGRAGTGKTTFLRHLREISSKRMVVLAPTGVAAINAQGATIHSFFQLPFAPYIPGKGFLSRDRKYLNISKQKRMIISSLSLLVIDEVSMVRPDMLDAIDMILRRVRHSSKPFGGVQLLLIGDLRQLPPVVKEDEWSHLSQVYSSPYFYSSHALQKAGFVTVELSSIYRQTHREFISLLNSVRDGNIDASALAALNKRYIKDFNPVREEGYIRLTTHNRYAAQINTSRLDSLPGEEYVFEAEVDGDFPENNFPVDKTLRLRVGAQVMFIKNDTGNARRFYNGMIGTVVDLSEDRIRVRPVGEGEEIDVELAEWENSKYVVDEATKAIVQQTVGSVKQYPLRLAWAITIHKSQGLTFDKAVIDAALAFAPGQAYVALSRCRSLEGLVLGSPLSQQAIITDGIVTGFIKNCEENAPTQETIEALKRNYWIQLLSELFDFSEIKTAFGDFRRYANEYLVPLEPSLYKKLEEINLKLRNDVDAVAMKFLSSLNPSSLPEGEDSSRSKLLDRVKKGCEYFLDILIPMASFFTKLPRNIENQAYAEKLNRSYDSLRFPLGVKLHMLQRLSKLTFSPEAYLRELAMATMEVESVVSSKKKSSSKRGVNKQPSFLASQTQVLSETSPKSQKTGENKNVEDNDTGQASPKKEKKKTGKKPKGYSAQETLKLYKAGKTVEEIAEIRKLAVSTIASHLGELLYKGLLDPGDIFSPAQFKSLTTLMENSQNLSFGEILSEYKIRNPETPLTELMFSIFWKYNRNLSKDEKTGE